MSGNIWIIDVLVGMVTMGACLYFLRPRNKPLDRIAAIPMMGWDGEPETVSQQEMAAPRVWRVLSSISRLTAESALRWLGPDRIASMRKTYAQSGISMAFNVYMAIRIFAVFAALLLGALLDLVIPIFPLAFTGAFACLALAGPPMVVGRRAKRRLFQIVRSLPGMLEMLAVSVQAGLTLDMAMFRSATADKGPLGQEFARVLNEIRLGRPRQDALLAMGERMGIPAVREVMKTLARSDSLGQGFADVLMIHSVELRELRRQRAEEEGRKAPIKMLLPMVGCIMPTIFLVLLGPALITTLHLK